MKIAEVAVYVAVNDLAGKLWNPKIRWRCKHSVIVEVTTDDGRSGIGECWCFDAAPDALVAFLASEVVPRLVGADALDRAGIAAGLADTATLSARHGIMASALSGVDIALWDLAARAEGVPLWRLIGGGEGDGRVRVYASGGLYGADKDATALAAEMAGYRARGFGAVKMKVGALAPEADAARVLAVREAIGPEAGLIIDGVYSFDAPGALSFFERVRPAAIRAFQSPLSADDVSGMAALTAAGVPVMGLEAEYRHLVIDLLLDRRALAILQFAPVACGGITGGLALIGKAAACGLPVSLEVSSTAVAQLAAFHLGAARAMVESVELHMVHQVLFEAFPFPPSAIAGGVLALPETPGLGLALPHDRLERRL
jgi:L-alanine-DL-glutamate epimerase-like enolase superfamily enzyme